MVRCGMIICNFYALELVTVVLGRTILACITILRAYATRAPNLCEAAMLKRGLFSLGFVAFLVVLQPQRVDAIPTVSVGSATQVVGDTFTIPVSVSGVTDLQAFQFDLSYDGTVLSVLSFTDVGTDFEAAATAGGGFLTGITGFSSSGLLSGVADSMSGLITGTGLTGNGVIVNVEFNALMAAVSPLTLSNVILNFTDQPDLSNGQVTVTGGQSMPEPTTLALLAIGLLAFGVRRKPALAWRIAT